MKKILHIVPSLDGGGIEHLLLNYYTNMNRDNVHFDFIVHGTSIGNMESIFSEMGSEIFHITPKSISLRDNLKEMREIIVKGNYDVVHAHQGAIGLFPMFIAKKAGVKVRITHSHQAQKESQVSKKIMHNILVIFLKTYATHWFACGIDAGIYLWGEKAYKNNKIIVLNNAIDLRKFEFNELTRNSLREELGVSNRKVIGNVGRFSLQKNHSFLIDIFNEIYKKDQNFMLILVGRGELEDEIKEKVSTLGLSKAVLFLGLRSDVNILLQAMDIFLLPSLYEGLPVVLVETQASALMSFTSDEVTKEVQVTEYINYLSLGLEASVWAERIRTLSNYEREEKFDKLEEKGYKIEREAKKLEYFYQNSEWKN